MGKKLLTYSLGIPLLLGISLTLPRVGVWIFYGTTQFQFRHKAKNSMRIYRDGKTVLFFNPGKTQISTRKFSEVKKHIRYACSRSFFRQGWKMIAITWIFSARLARLEIQARFENTGLGCLARAGMHPGPNPSPCFRRRKLQKKLGWDFSPVSLAEISVWDKIRYVIRPLNWKWRSQGEGFSLGWKIHVNAVTLSARAERGTRACA